MMYCAHAITQKSYIQRHIICRFYLHSESQSKWH